MMDAASGVCVPKYSVQTVAAGPSAIDSGMGVRVAGFVAAKEEAESAALG